MKKLYLLGGLIILAVLLLACSSDIPAAPQPYDPAPLEAEVEQLEIGLSELEQALDNKADSADVTAEMGEARATVADNFAATQAQYARFTELMTRQSNRALILESGQISPQELANLIDSKIAVMADNKQLEQEVARLESKLVALNNRISALESIIENFFSSS